MAAVQLHVRMVGIVLRMPLTMCVCAVMVTVAKTVKLVRIIIIIILHSKK